MSWAYLGNPVKWKLKVYSLKLKSNSKDQVEDWINFINQNKKEALSTLKNEHVVLETFFNLN